MRAGMAGAQWQEHGVASHSTSATRKLREISARDPSPCTGVSLPQGESSYVSHTPLEGPQQTRPEVGSLGL